MHDKVNFKAVATASRTLVSLNGDVIGQKVAGFIDFNDDDRKTPFELNVMELDTVNWSAIDTRCQIDPNVPKSRVRRSIANELRKMLNSVPKVTEYQVENPGLYIIEGKPVFCTAAEIIRSPGSANALPMIKFLGSERLDVEARLSEADTIHRMLNLICLCPNPGRIILSAVLVFLLRQAYVEAGIRPWICLYLYGKTGMQKTTYSSFLVQLYNRSEGIKSPTRLNATTAAAAEMLVKNRDSLVIFDDLFPSDQREITRQQEETLIEITRYVSDGTIPLRKRGNKLTDKPPECGILFTGEYLIGEGSDAARLLPIEMTKPDSEKLKFFQDNPLIVSTFYRNFIAWAVENYNDIVNSLKNLLSVYREINMGVHDRLQEVHFLLHSAYLLLLNYMIDKEYLSKQEASELKDDFLSLLSKLVRTQNERTKPNRFYAQSKKIDYLAYIKEMYHNSRIILPAIPKGFDPKTHNGVIYNGNLCLRGEFLEKIFNTPSKEIADSLRSNGALHSSGNGNTIQINALGGKRFYAIPLECLE